MADAKIVFTAEDQTKAAVESAKAGLRGLGTTAVAVSGQTQQALRMLPAQITDIVTGLASGQAPMTVLIQQGGQLKDMFGGVGAAARAVAGYVVGLINPFTLAAAAVGGLALAWHEGSKEAEAYTRAIIMSGNAAGTTTAQLQQIAQRVAAVTGTVGQAADALAQLVASGQIPNDSLERYAALVVRLDRVGISAKDVVADLAALGKDPVAASQKLDAAMNYLEASTLRQIKSLQEQGRTQEAAELAQKAYAAAWEERYGKLEGNLSTLSKAWLDIKKEAGEAWDAMKGIGRADSVEQQLEKVREQLVRARALQGQFPYEAGAEITKLLELEKRLTEQTKATVAAQKESAEADRKRTDQKRAGEEFDQLVERNRTQKERIRIEQERARNLGADAGRSQAEIDAVVGNIGYEETKRGIETQIQRLKTLTEIADVRAKALVAEIQFQRAMGVLNERAATEQTADTELAAMRRKRDFLEREIALKSKERDSEKDVAAIRGQVEVLDAQIAEKRVSRAQALAELDHKREQAIYAVIRAEQEQFHTEQDLERVAASKRWEQAQLQVLAYAQSIEDANKQLDFEASLLGKSADEQARLNEQQRISNGLRDQKRQIEERGRGGNLTADQQNTLNQDAEAAAAQALSKVDTRLYIDKWKSVNQQVADGLYDVLTGKGKDAADRIKQIFGDMVLRPMLQPIANTITNTIVGGIGQAGSAGGAGGADGGGMGSLMNAASTAGSLYSVGSAAAAAYTAGSTSVGVMAGSVAGAGGVTGGLAAAGSAALAAIPVAGWIALAAIAAYSIFGGKGGGPKTESGFGIDVPLRGDPKSAKMVADSIQQQYAAIVGPVAGKLDLGVFSAADPQGDALTQLAVNARLNGQQVYSREARTGGIENVGRSQEELSAAIAEDSARAVFAAIKATDGLSDSMRAIIGSTDAYSSSIDEINAKMTRAVKAETERKNIEEQIYALTHTDAEILARQRQREKDALDDTNKALADRVYALQDEKKMQEAVAAASKEAADTILNVTRTITGYLDKLNATDSGMLSPEQQVANARSQFDRQLGLARSGDRDALQSLTSYADQYIQAQTAYTFSGSPTQDAISYVKQTLSGLDYGSLRSTLQSQNVANSGALNTIPAAPEPAQLGNVAEKLGQLVSMVGAYMPQSLETGLQIAESVAQSAWAAKLAKAAA